MTSARGSAARHAGSTPDLGPSADIASLARVFDMDVMRERILAAAITIVSDRGFGACTVREVAEAVGIKAPGLYSHFTSKEAILTEAVSRVLTDFMDVAATVTGADPEEELRETVRRHVLYQIDNMQIARVADLFLNTGTAGHFLSADEYDRLHSEQRVYIDLVSDRVAAFAPRLPAAELPVISIAIIAMCDHVANWFHTGDTLGADELAELHWQLARSMIIGRASNAGSAV